jgi:hypothetical protein
LVHLTGLYKVSKVYTHLLFLSRAYAQYGLENSSIHYCLETIMKLLLLVLFATATWACQYDYHYCHCTNSDGSPNDQATATVCTGDPPGYWEGENAILQPYIDDPLHHLECRVQDDLYDDLFDNCFFRMECNACGAMGDSNCRNAGTYQ